MVTKSQVVVTRDRLYEEVWTEPMRSVAARYGISDVALAKICRKLEVPRPDRGYWARKRAGQEVRRLPLAPRTASGRQQVFLRPDRYRRRLIDESTSGPVAEQAGHEARPENQIVVPDEIPRLHPAVRRAQKQFRAAVRQAASDPWGRNSRPQSRLDPSSLPRASRILDTLVRALEQRGFHVDESGEPGFGILARVRETEIPVRVEERYEAQDPPSTSSRYTRPQGPRPSGQLALVIALSTWDVTGVRRKWSDGRRQRVEDLLNDVVVGLVHTAEAWKEADQIREKEQRQFQEKIRLSEERRRRAAEDKARIDELQRQAAAWADHRRLQEYVKVLRWRAEQLGELTPASEIETWIQWAEECVQRTDPLRRLEEQLLRLKMPEVKGPWGW